MKRIKNAKELFSAMPAIGYVKTIKQLEIENFKQQAFIKDLLNHFDLCFTDEGKECPEMQKHLFRYLCENIDENVISSRDLNTFNFRMNILCEFLENIESEQK